MLDVAIKVFENSEFVQKYKKPSFGKNKIVLKKENKKKKTTKQTHTSLPNTGQVTCCAAIMKMN